MSVPALTTKFGHFQHYTGRVRPYTGTQGDGSQIDWSYLENRHCGESVRQEPNKNPVYILGTRVKAPKDYLRIATRVVTDEPFIVSEGGYSDAYSRNIGYFLNGSVEPRIPPDAGETMSNHYAKSATKALNKLRDRNQLELGVDALEGRKTMQMIAAPAERLLLAYRAARQGRWGSLPGLLGLNNRDLLTGKTTANLWLQYQYGWRPLMSSIDTGMKKLSEGLRSGVPVYRVRSTSKEPYDYNMPYDPFNSVQLSGTFGVKTGIYYAIANATADFVDGLGLLNPLSIAWELVPFSFVLDWFIPVGNCLSALTSTAGLEFRAGYTTEVRETRESITYNSRPSEDPHYHLVSPGVWHSESFFMSRKALTAFPRPQLYANAHPWSSDRITSALALLRQLL